MFKIFKQALSVAGLYWTMNRQLDKGEKKEAMADFDEAMIKAKDKKNPSTLGVEEWFKKYRR